MKLFQLTRFGAITLACVALVACGGGDGTPPPSGSVSISNVALPAVLSGDYVDYEIPLAGGCGGPYVINILTGALPEGLSVDVSQPDQNEPGRHHIVGYCLTEGDFTFELEIVDTGCDPFQATVATLHWSVGTGPLNIVDSNPGLITAERLNASGKYDDVHALPTVIFGQFSSIDLLVAGGKGPYHCAIVDDPADAMDGALPLGVSMPPESCSLVGAPSEILGSGRPFRLTVRATDSVGNTVQRKFQWSISTPAVVLVASGLREGQVGVPYADSFQVASGVPPFRFELVDDVPHQDPDDFEYVSGQAPTFTSDTGFTVDVAGQASNRLTADGGANGGSTATYPPANASGLLGPMPPEGIYLNDSTTGTAVALTGMPRRAGAFQLHVHAYSSIVPNSRGQHAFGTVTLQVGAAADLVVNPVFTNEGAFTTSDPYASLPELETGAPYNPDGGPLGLQMLGSGGVGLSRYSSAPHASQRILDTGAIPNAYQWAVDWDPVAAGTSIPNAVEVTSDGRLLATDSNALVRQGAQVIEVEVTDYQIPPNTATALCTVSVGPDVVILTHSTQSWSGIYNYYSIANRQEPNDNQMRIRKFQAFVSAPQMGPLAGSDLTPGTTVPSTAGLDTHANPLGALLSGIAGGDEDLDLLRCTINPTGWWDDTNGMNVNGARPFQHSDPNTSYPLYGQNGSSWSLNANWQPSASSVDLPNVDNLTENRSQGIFANGGRCYHFESDSRFGVFIIRSNATIYVPFAMEKSGAAGEGGFGDGIFEAKTDGQQHSLLRTVQMTVSPNGRIAAMKLKQSPTNQLESADSSRILLFSLTGEAMFGGKTWKIVESGVAATGSTSGRYLCGNSLALTDTHLYFLMGTQTTLYYQSWSSFYIMRYEVASTDTAAQLLPSDGSNSNWTQASTVPMQTVFQHWYLNPYRESTTAYGSVPYHRYWYEDGANFVENGMAPMPFRVSKNGKACAILAGSNATTTLSTLVYSNFLWVDYEGSGVRQASSSRRHATTGGGRGYSLSVGPSEYAMWGRFTGPTTGLEISDDGLRAAFTYTNTAGSVYATQSGTSNSHSLALNRQDVVCCSTTASDLWSNASNTVEKEVTATAFAGAHRWRFGALVFTADSDGLVFWGGSPTQDATTTNYLYMQSLHFNGTMYACGNLDSTTSSVTSTCTTANGGSPDGIKTYTTGTSAFNPSGTTGLTNRYGTLLPYGGFLSKNRNFLYLCDMTGVTTSANTGCMLIGWNISTLANGSVNSHPNGEGFLLTDWPTRRGFIGNYVGYPGYCLYYGLGYAPAGHHGGSRHAMARDTGDVFWGAQYQYSGPNSTTSTTYGGPIIPTFGYGCYGYGGVGIYGFNADLGGAVATLSNPSFTADSTTIQERLHYLDVSDDGSKVAYVSSAYYYYSKYDAERVNLISDVSFATANGSIHAGFDRSSDSQRLEATNGRAGESIAVIPRSTDVYYAFKAGASDDTAQEIVKVNVEPGTSTATKTVFALTGRMNILFAGR